jgi:hypothetical protein
MNKTGKAFLTFGQNHRHQIGEQIFDKDTVCIIEANTEEEARDIAFKTFSNKWCFLYFEESWREAQMEYYPKGYVALVEKKPTMTKNEKLFTLLTIAKENGWENIPNFYEYFIEDQYASLGIDELNCRLNNNMFFDDFKETSLNDLIGNFEPKIVSFVHALFNYAYSRNTLPIYNSIIAKLQTDITLPTVYDARELLPANWFYKPTSERLDWFLEVLTPLIEHYEATKLKQKQL